MGVFVTEAINATPALVKRYNRLAKVYDWYTDYEAVHHAEAAALADLGPRDRVLDVACGTGRGLAALSARLDPDVERHGVDLTPGMLERARRRFDRLGLGSVSRWHEGSATALPFPDASFDVVYSGYFFDLVHLDAMAPVLAELNRVLVPGGRLVLVNMSKNVVAETRYERFYSRGTLGIFSGACRPVLMAAPVAAAGFERVERHYRENRSVFFLNRWFGTEIVLAKKPGLPRL